MISLYYIEKLHKTTFFGVKVDMQSFKKTFDFLQRYKVLLILLAISIILLNIPIFWSLLGTLVYAPALCVGVVLTSVLIRSIFNNHTTDPYVGEGQFTKDFNSLPAAEKVKYTLIQSWIYIIAFALIFSAIAR